jgi:hypothetical protein
MAKEIILYDNQTFKESTTEINKEIESALDVEIV